MMALAQERFPWPDGMGTVAQSQAQERLHGQVGAGTILQAQWNRNNGTGTMARARQMSCCVCPADTCSVGSFANR
jgi:hypothetical protein